MKHSILVKCVCECVCALVVLYVAGFWTSLSHYNHLFFAPMSAELEPCCTWIHTEQPAHLKTTGHWCPPQVTPSAPQQWSSFYFRALLHRGDLSLSSFHCAEDWRNNRPRSQPVPAEANPSGLLLLSQLTWFRSKGWSWLICTTLTKAPKELRWSCFTVIYTQIPYRNDPGKHQGKASTEE